MVGTVIVVRPAATSPSLMSFQYAGELLQWVSGTGVNVIDMPKGMANQAVFYGNINRVRLESDSPPLVCYYGHGVKDKLLGDVNITGIPILGEHLAMIKDGWNTEWLKNAIVYAFACDTALQLGESAVKEGALAYFGNLSPTHVGFKEEENDYSVDFTVIANTIPKAIINGFSMHQAMKAFRDTCKYYIMQYRAKDNWPHADYYEYAIKSLYDNYRLFIKEDFKWSGV